MPMPFDTIPDLVGRKGSHLARGLEELARRAAPAQASMGTATGTIVDAATSPPLRDTIVDVLGTALQGRGPAPASKAARFLKPAAKLAGRAAGPIGIGLLAKDLYDAYGAYKSMDPDPWYLAPASRVESIEAELPPPPLDLPPPPPAPRPREGGRRAPSVPSRSELFAGAKRPFLEQNVVVDDEGRSSEEMSWTPERGDTISGLARSLLGARARPADVKALSDKIVRLLGGDRVYAGRTYDLSGLDAPTGPAPAPTGIPMSVPLPELALPPMGRPPPLEQHRRMLGEPPPANLTRDVIDRRHRFAPGRAEELVSGLHSRGGRGPAR